MAEQYYYCYSLPLEPGSIIKPGNWGRIINTYTPESSPNSWLFSRELIFEQIRLSEFPEKPSRLESIFLCLDEATIKEFKIATNRNLDIIYKVELVDSGEPQHTGDYTLADIQRNDNFFSLKEKAIKYWKGEGITKAELITTSRIQVIEMIKE